MAKKSKRKNNTPVLAIVAIILVIVLILVFNKDFVNNAKSKFKDGIDIAKKTEAKREEANTENIATKDKPKKEKNDIVIEFKDKPEKTKKEKEAEKEVVIDIEEKKDVKSSVVENKKNDAIRKSLNTTKTRKKLYFIKYNDSDQGYVLQAVNRTITYQDSILTQTLSILMYGPNGSEINSELATLIQPQTKLLSVSVKDGVAYLNFNEDFMYHEFGQEGFITQLKQFVFTATEFATVDSVQFLIEGKKVDYTPESVEIGKPFTRNSF